MRRKKCTMTCKYVIMMVNAANHKSFEEENFCGLLMEP